MIGGPLSAAIARPCPGPPSFFPKGWEKGDRPPWVQEFELPTREELPSLFHAEYWELAPTSHASIILPIYRP